MPLTSCGANLLTNGDFVAFGDQARDIVFGCMIRHTGHRDFAAALFACRQDQIEFFGRNFGVLIKHLVEVAESKEENGIGILCLGVEILATRFGWLSFC